MIDFSKFPVEESNFKRDNFPSNIQVSVTDLDIKLGVADSPKYCAHAKAISRTLGEYNTANLYTIGIVGEYKVEVLCLNNNKRAIYTCLRNYDNIHMHLYLDKNPRCRRFHLHRTD